MLPTIWRSANGLGLREKAAHDRANTLVKTAVAISFGYSASALNIGRAAGWEMAALALATFWVVAALYLGTVAALAEVRTLRVKIRGHRRALRCPDIHPQGFMAIIDLIALLLAAVLPIAIIMFASDLARLHH
ncbi:hypothetical protein NPJ82_10350 [Sphingomonas sp. NY01]|uniref:hypothetical protein n=1 Tax=Sphingomonas sp. NY01 TaxID=2968057 RepID=UPI00315D6855